MTTTEPTARGILAKLRADETAAFEASIRAKASVVVADEVLRNLGRKSIDGVLEPFPPAMLEALKAAQLRLDVAIRQYRAASVARRAAEADA